MQRSLAMGRVTAVAAVVLVLVATVPAWASPSTVRVGIGEAVAAINAACAATQPLAESGLRVSDTGIVVGAYDRAAGVAERAWDGPGRGLILTTSPPGLYRGMPPYEASFSKRALSSLGRVATWTLDPAPSVVLRDVIPSPGELIRTTLTTPRADLAPVTQCASTLLANPARGTVFAQRTDEAGGTAWRVVAGADYFGLDNDYENGKLLIIHVTAQGLIDRVERGWISSDGLSALGQDLRWEYGVQPVVAVPAATATVDWDRYVAARAAFIGSDLKAFARATARRPLQAATQTALRTRVRNALTLARFDPMFPSGSSTTRSSVIVWQKDTMTSTVHAIRFDRRSDGKRIVDTEVAGFTP